MTTVREASTVSGRWRAAGSSAIVQALADWLDGHVLVLDEQRRMVFASESFLRMLRLEPGQVMGRRIGEAFGCVHEPGTPAGCGSGLPCRFCLGLDAIQRGQRSRGTVEGEYPFTVSRPDGPETLRYDVRSTAAEEEDERLTVLLLQAPRSGGADGDEETLVRDLDWPEALERYLRVRRLGIGAMGAVYLVEGPDGQRRALKTVRANRIGDREAVRRFRQEAQLSRLLEHPNIVRTHDVDRTPDGVLYLICEYCEQGNAAQWLQTRGPLPVELAVAWMIGVARALGHAWHEHRMIHRDVKPDNLLIDASGQIKLSDFGVARQLGRAAPRLTTDGTTVGSAHYMSPEQAVGADDIDVQADLYAYGATFHRLLGGRHPFAGDGPLSILHQKVSRDAPSILGRRPDLPPVLAGLLDSLLLRDRSRRPADPSHVEGTLTDLADSSGMDLEGALELARRPGY